MLSGITVTPVPESILKLTVPPDSFRVSRHVGSASSLHDIEPRNNSEASPVVAPCSVTPCTL